MKCLRSFGFKAAFVGESEEKEQQMLECKVNFDFINSSPGSFVGDVQIIFSKDFYQSNTVAIHGL